MDKKIKELDAVDKLFLREIAAEEGTPLAHLQVCLLCVYFARGERGPVCRRVPTHPTRYSEDWCGEFAENERLTR